MHGYNFPVQGKLF